MKVLSSFIFVGILPLYLFCQTVPFYGIRSSQRGGIHAAMYNPADLSQMRQAVDIHLFGLNPEFNNNILPIPVSEFGTLTSQLGPILSSALKGELPEIEIDQGDLINRVENIKTPVNIRLGMELMGPAFAFTAGKIFSIGVFSRVRGLLQIKNIDVPLASSLWATGGEVPTNLPYTISTASQSIALMGWTELGGTLAIPLINNQQNTLKAGLNLKVLFPNIYAHGYLDKTSLTLSNVGDQLFLHGKSELGYYLSNPDNLQNSIEQKKLLSNQRAFDIGFSYLWKNQKGNYRLKLGLSMLDIGSLSFPIREDFSMGYNLDIPTNKKWSLESADEPLVDLKAKGFLKELKREETIKELLPRSLNFFMDFRLLGPFYLSFSTLSPLTDATHKFRAQSLVNATPRFFINQFIEAYLPVTFTGGQRFIGAGVKIGILYIGSNSLVSSFLDAQDNYRLDFHFGIRKDFGKTNLEVKEKEKDEEEAQQKLKEQQEYVQPKIKEQKIEVPKEKPIKPAEVKEIPWEKKEVPKVEEPKPLVIKPGELLKDIDGNKYKTMLIGDKHWMAENLKVTRFNDGEKVAEIREDVQWSEYDQSAWSAYNHSEAFEKVVGKLYNGYVVQYKKEICPLGWHVPSEKEWNELTEVLGGAKIAGPKMKSINGWSSTLVGNNRSGLNGLPGGGRRENGRFDGAGKLVAWWTTTPDETGTKVWNRFLSFDRPEIARSAASRNSGFSIRCKEN